MNRRRRREEEPENHERWLVSYADFITLLFAFFVVMYAISSVNEGKYRVLSTAIVEAFRAEQLTVSPTPPSGGANTMIAVPNAKPVAKEVKASPKIDDSPAGRERARLAQLADELMKATDPLIRGGQVRVTHSALGVAIEIKDSALFPVGQAAPSPQSRQVLAEVARILSGVDNPVRVEGFTDNVPINNPVYPSNWELSAARAGSVVRLFVENGIAPARLVAIGRAENLPVAANDDDAGRAQNRRVAITVLSSDPERGEPAGVSVAPQP
ncbi:chemotaxis protein MotB [Crenobacter luteus]|uniref:Flagellar motor protein MotD n=1 Tax=Crenobacter luteus TaxID=1452487 RepID=A0A163BBB5_9NEIS|nr:flagellar motor protein MotD [Crenobacter luteus]KZE25896.1 flagellar motor protein MotD [Crenobacter luteus]TCP14547.1 chemotaxis protein MotB [Crenobacter luteus]